MAVLKTEQGRINALQEQLLRFWKTGIRLSEGDRFFMESGLGISGPGELEEILNQKGDPDRETLIERLLFPDASLRRILEPFTGPQGLSKDLEGTIIRKLSTACPEICIRHPESQVPLLTEVSFSQVEGFVSRLFLCRSLPQELCQALDHCRPEAEALSCRVMLRCRKMEMSPEKEALLVRFVRESSGGYPDFEDLFHLCVDLLSDAPAGKDPGIYLQERRRQEKTQLRQIRRFEEERERWGMEYLMMSRYQVPCESREAVAARLDLMETIIYGILCLPPLPEDLVQHRDLGRFEKDGSLSDLIGRLS